MAPSKKPSSPWLQCENCKTYVVHKEIEQHSTECPPSIENPSHFYIKDDVLYGCLDIKSNEDIKGISPQERENLVFLSQSVIQLCGLCIGEYAIISDISKQFTPYARIVWPTNEKSITSVLLTKNDLDLVFEKSQIKVTISKVVSPIKQARQIVLISLNNSNISELCPELQNRIQKMYLNRLLSNQNKIKVMFYGRILKFEVKSICPIKDDQEQNIDTVFNRLSINDLSQFFRVTEKTKWNLYENEVQYEREINNNLLSRIRGLNEEIEEIRHLMNVSLEKTASILNAAVFRGVLLYGASGTGKTSIANALAKESGENVINVCLANLYDNKSGTAEETLGKWFADAINSAPTVIVIDEIDIFCPSKTSRMTDVEKKIMASILNMFDYINETPNSKIFVLATSNKPDSIDSAFRRCGRLDREIEIPVPNRIARLDILNKLLQNVPIKLDINQIQEVANNTHGFVGSDLVALTSSAALHATKFMNKEIDISNFKFAMTQVRPSAMREVQIEIPNVKWSDIGGQEELKLILRQSIDWPLKHPERFTRLGITPPRGILMFGPPGCSKTMIAKALATESDLNFLSIKGPELFSKWVGESERAVREIFRKARQVAPSVIFFDEIDALGGERSASSSTNVQERVLAQLLTELDGVSPLGDVTILAATNRPDKIDKALLRPGRLDRIVYVPLPDDKTRREIFKLKLSKMPVSGVNLDELITLTNGYSGAEVNAVCHEAAMKALEENLNTDQVEMRHFEKALKAVTPRTPSTLLKLYDDYANINYK